MRCNIRPEAKGTAIRGKGQSKRTRKVPKQSKLNYCEDANKSTFNLIFSLYTSNVYCGHL